LRLEEIIEKTECEIVSGETGSVEINQGYACDLLSEVMATGSKSDIWITVQSHSNIVAVAAITGIKCIILANGRDYNDDTFSKAKNEGIVLLKSKLDTFTISGIIYEMLQR